MGGGGGGDDDVLWACTHVGCYGTADVLQGLHTFGLASKKKGTRLTAMTSLLCLDI